MMSYPDDWVSKLKESSMQGAFIFGSELLDIQHPPNPDPRLETLQTTRDIKSLDHWFLELIGIR